MYRGIALLISLSRIAAFAPRPRFTLRVAARRSEDGGFLDATEADIRRPKPSASAEAVVTAQMNALQAGDAMRAFKFASPANKQVTGPWRRFKAMLEKNPEYAPMLACSRWEFEGILGDAQRKAARVRVFPAGGSAAPYAVNPVVEYTFSLSKQPEVADVGDEGYAVSGC